MTDPSSPELPLPAPDPLPETVSVPPLPPVPKRGYRIFLILFFCFFAVLAFSGIGLFVLATHKGFLESEKTLVIQKGFHLAQIGQILQQNGIVENEILFRILTHLLADDNLHAGEYKFLPSQSLVDMIAMMHEGRTVVHRLTIPEGLTTAEILQLIKDDPFMDGEVTLQPKEGALLPETYHYSYADPRNAFIARLQKAATEQLQTLWEKRDKSIPLKTPHEALIFASLIEKETGKKAEERPRVASVFYNRLRLGMRLQSDPTVIYALTKGKEPLGRDLTHQDLEISSAYNTYVNTGLPPEPICNPGKASLEAALHPEKTDFLYFVADGSGGHAFAKDLVAHNKNVVKWKKSEKETLPMPLSKPVSK